MVGNLGLSVKHLTAWAALEELYLKHTEINSAIYMYLAAVTAAEASVSSISACLSMMDESLIFLISAPPNIEPNVLGSQITNRAVQRSPNQAKHFVSSAHPCYEIR